MNKIFFGNWDTAGGGLLLGEKKIELWLHISGDYEKIYSDEIKLDSYYTIVGVYDGNEMSIYIDGKKISSSQVNGNIQSINMPILLGGNPTQNGAPYNVSYTTFTDALVFDSALSETEIREYFGETIDKDKVLNKYVNTESDQKLLLYYKFD